MFRWQLTAPFGCPVEPDVKSAEGGFSKLHERHLVAFGETLYVTSGQAKLKGTLSSLDSRSLTLRTGSGPLTIHEHEHCGRLVSCSAADTDVLVREGLRVGVHARHVLQ